MRISKLVLVLSACLMSSMPGLAMAEGASAKAAAKKPAQKTSAELEAVKKAIGKAECESSDQCKTVAMGAKACGGPEFFLAWSSLVKGGVAPANIPELASKHRMAREAQILAEGEMSDCKVVTDPGAQCVASKCALKPPSKVGASAS